MQDPKKKKKCLSAAIFVCLLLATTAQRCGASRTQPTVTPVTDQQLLAISQRLLVIAKSNSQFSDTVIYASDHEFISDDTEVRLLNVSAGISTGLLKASALVRDIHALDQKERGQLLEIVDPLLEALDGATEETGLIKNSTVRDLLLIAIRHLRGSIAEIRELSAGHGVVIGEGSLKL